MRAWVVAVALMGAANGAQAADYMDLPVLRGSFRDAPAPRGNWDRFYAGGQFGYTMADMDFTHATSALTDTMLKNDVLQSSVGGFDLMQKNHTNGTGFGGFVGKNWQWEDAIVGVEVNYNRFSNISSSSGGVMNLNITNPPGLVKPDSDTYIYNTKLEGRATLAIQDVLTFRVRAGWDAGAFMPYMFGGAAIGRLDPSRSATLNVSRTIDRVNTAIDPLSGITYTYHTTIGPTARPEQSLTEARGDSFVGGYTAGLGTEMALTDNLFARVEWEYVKFLKTKDITSNLNTFRGGIGYRF